MKEIKLKRGKVAIVDDEDYAYLSRFNWSLNNGHVSRQVCVDKKHLTIYLVFLIKKKKSNERFVFINRNPLDLRKENIRVITWSNSAVLSKKTKNKTSSKYKGVFWNTRSKRWIAFLFVRNKEGVRKKILYKSFDNEIDAAIARDEKVKEIFGEFVYQNVLK